MALDWSTKHQSCKLLPGGPWFQQHQQPWERIPADLMPVTTLTLKPSNHSFLTWATQVGQNQDICSEPTYTKPQQTLQSMLYLNIQLWCTTAGHVSACLQNTPQGCLLGMVGSACFFLSFLKWKQWAAAKRLWKPMSLFQEEKTPKPTQTFSCSFYILQKHTLRGDSGCSGLVFKLY